MTKKAGGYRVPAIRIWCLVAVCALALGPHPAAADITPTGNVDAVDVVGATSTPLTASAGDQTFGPEIQITLDVGQLQVDLSTVLTAGTLLEIDAGSVIVTGAGSQISLIADRNRLDIQGTASEIQILNSGVIDATGGTCNLLSCNIYIGNLAGADVTLVVDGAESELNTINNFFVADGNTDFGILGADTVATVDILNGGTITSDSVVVSRGLSGGNIQVGQMTDATVNISGAGSGRDSTSFQVAQGLNAIAIVNVTSGGIIDTDFFSAAQDPTAVANISVDGAGSQIQVIDMLIGQSGTAIRLTHGLRFAFDKVRQHPLVVGDEGQTECKPFVC